MRLIEYYNMIVDTHAHLYFKHFRKERDAIIQRAIESGVSQIFLPNVDKDTIAGVYELATNYPDTCFAMMGIHPCYIKEDFEEHLAAIAHELNNAPCKLYAVGEIGLDFYWDVTYKEEQKMALRQQIELAKQHELPIVLHCRESFDETYEIVKELKDERLSGIFHCFTGKVADAEKVIELGDFYMGLGGVLTYRNSPDLQETVKAIDLKHFVLETDAPFLPPEPYRSAKDRKKRRNESSYMVEVAKKVAALKNISYDEVAAITTQNAHQAFKFAQVPS